MTLLDTIRMIERIAMEQPAVNMICENDVYKLNADGNDWRYGAFAFTQGQHTASVEGDFNTFSFTLFYVDRLMEDKSNQLAIQSAGVEVLNNILAQLDERGIIVGGGYTIQPFNQRFADECAGVFTNVTLDVLKGATCSEGFADFNGDFNNDFLII